MMKRIVSPILFGLMSIFVLTTSCNKDSDNEEDQQEQEEISTEADLSVIKDKFYNITWSTGESEITINTTVEPDHKSMYYDPNNDLYESYDEPNNPDFYKNPNSIVAQNYTFKIPRYPTEASSKQSTDFDAIGVALNGVVFFNQNAAPGDDILEELNTFDQWEGHPQPQGVYHYHIEPPWLTTNEGDEALIGVLLDGFPVYGPVEDGVRLTNDDLDEYHGHEHATVDFPDGIYHYHITDDLPWINGGEYFGTPGTSSN